MLGSVSNQEIAQGIATAVKWDAFLLLSALLYVVFAVGLFDLGAKAHAATVRKDVSVGMFPGGYFMMLAVQLIPLTITGLVLHDPFIIGTRFGTLVVVLVVYGLATSNNGTFDTWRFKFWTFFWLIVAILGPMVWSKNESIRPFVREHQMWIAWIAVAAMVLFVARGQWEVAKTLFLHFLAGNYTVKRLSLQIVRFFAFLLQAIHYWMVPSAAPKFLGFDPVFIQGALGAGGVLMVLCFSAMGYIRGTAKRRYNKKQDAARAEAHA